jgi:DNA-binding response OmpR family regulator
MKKSALQGRSILIVEDEPLIAMDLAQAFEKVGAFVTTTATLRQALLLARYDDVAAAVVDHSLGEEDSSELCTALKQRDIPFVIYSGFDHIDGTCSEAPHVHKPAAPEVLLAAVERAVAMRT